MISIFYGGGHEIGVQLVLVDVRFEGGREMPDQLLGASAVANWTQSALAVPDIENAT